MAITVVLVPSKCPYCGADILVNVGMGAEVRHEYACRDTSSGPYWREGGTA
jgi:hypothetical protein